MAKPRVFISSTFYDLKQIRVGLELFIREYGFEPVLNERGMVAYPSHEPLERGAYREVELCDILIAVIGGRYGTQSEDGVYSITQQEIKRAHEKGKQIYIFIERSVYDAYQVYLLNKEREDIKYPAGSPDVFRFIEELEHLPQNNAIAPFDLASELTTYLREQWSAMFHRLLQDSASGKDIQAMMDFKTAASTLKQLVTFLTEERKNTSEVIHDILLSNHPAFAELQQKLAIGHRVFFGSKAELEPLLKAYGYQSEYDPFADEVEPEDTWVRDTPTEHTALTIAAGAFDATGKLVPPSDWQSNFLTVKRKKKSAADDYDPFA